jgi:hypothetical protein
MGYELVPAYLNAWPGGGVPGAALASPGARGRVSRRTAPPLLLAGLGLTHPNDLTGTSAGWWTSLHIILVPLFPLLWRTPRGQSASVAWPAEPARTHAAPIVESLSVLIVLTLASQHRGCHV